MEMPIDWKARVKNKVFWLTFIPAILLVVQVVAAPFGYHFDFVVLNQQLAAIVNAVFAVLVILGIPVDMSTAGFGDAKQTLSYTEPRKE